MQLRLIITALSFVVAFGLLHSFPVAAADVGVIPETSEAEPPPMILNFSGAGCDVNAVESELLRVRGVLGVDIESKPGKIIVTYDAAKLTKQNIMGAVGKRKKGCAASEDVVSAVGGELKAKANGVVGGSKK